MKYRVVQLGDGVIKIAVEDPAPTAEAIISIIHSVYVSDGFKSVLWDLSQASLCHLNSDDLFDILEAGAIYTRARGKEAKTAILCRTIGDKYLMEALAARAMLETTVPNKPSTDINTLLRWLDVPDPSRGATL